MDTVPKGTLVAVLAAGASRRMGSPKLLQTSAGFRLLDHAIEVACSSKAERVCVVTGAYRQETEDVVSRFGVTSIFNQNWELGQSTSVAAAARYCQETSGDSLIIMLADQPHMTAGVLDRIYRALGEGSADVYRSTAPGYRGNPCGFRRSCFPALENLTGDEGARQFFKAAPAHGFAVEDISFDDAGLFEDVDTRGDFERLTAKMESLRC